MTTNLEEIRTKAEALLAGAKFARATVARFKWTAEEVLCLLEEMKALRQILESLPQPATPVYPYMDNPDPYAEPNTVGAGPAIQPLQPNKTWCFKCNNTKILNGTTGTPCPDCVIDIQASYFDRVRTIKLY